MTPRDAAEYNEASEAPDMGEICDSPSDRVSDIIHEFMPEAKPLEIHKLARFVVKVMERANPYREDMRATAVLNLARSVITTCLFPRPNEIRCMAASYALDLGLHGNKPMAETAKTMGVTRASLSNEAWKIVRINGLPPSRWMRSEEATKANREARDRVLTNNTPQP